MRKAGQRCNAPGQKHHKKVVLAMPDEQVTPKKKQLSGWERARLKREAQGLSRYGGDERRIAKNAERYRLHRAMTDSIKLERGCADCGYNAHPAALDFDHLPGSKKKTSVSQICSWKDTAVVLAELAKCEVVCANCHRVRTVERRKQAKAEAFEPYEQLRLIG